MANVDATNNENKVTVRLNGANADITAGGNGTGENGALILKNSLNHTIVSLGSILVSGGPMHPSLEVNKFELASRGGKKTFSVLAESADVEIGGGGTSGSLKVVGRDDFHSTTIRSGTIEVRDPDNNVSQFRVGKVSLGKEGKSHILLDGTKANVRLGGHGQNGELMLFSQTEDAIDNPTKATIYLDGTKANLRLGGHGQNGDLMLFDQFDTATDDHTKASIYLNGTKANLRLGGHGQNGELLLFPFHGTATDDPTKATIHLDGTKGNVRLGGNGQNGDLMLFPQTEIATDDHTKATIHLDGTKGNIRLGGNGKKGELMLFSSAETRTDDHTKATVYLDGTKGDIVLSNADCAEDFDIAESGMIEPGTVMVLDQDGKLQQSTGAYDKKVAGVISGAGDFKPGIVLDKKQTASNRLPVALMGKVYCKADAQYSSIEVGDLLTTSDTPGHAMKAMEPFKAFGAVIGKALRPLRDGQGLIPILIALQ